MIKDDHIDFEIAALIDKYLRNDIQEEELLVLEKWREAHHTHAELWARLTNVDYAGTQLRQWPDDTRSDTLWSQVQRATTGKQRRFPLKRIFAYAAALAVFAMAGLSVYYGVFQQADPLSAAHRETPDTAPQQVTVPEILVPPAAANEITLIMGDGKTVALGDNPDLLHEQDGTQITETGSGLAYATEKRSAQLPAVMNTVITPVARTYHLTLADGTRVWLNAASAIRYPTAFDGEERRVTLKGEAYFEVAHDRDKPFIVVTEQSQIRVLGTRFNVKSYPEDKTDRTALLDGSLQVSSRQGTQSTLLQPGYEAVVTGEAAMVVNKADARKVLAWKDGLFIFENESLVSLMHELATWYGIKAQFADNEVKNYHFTGRLRRYTDIQFLLDIIAETSKVQFTLRNGILSIDKIHP
ncbi:FecR family protein [Parapedobacter lycopersici]|uniref:FecR family protein n=1 Tax=Parapedobacter lycopersici TaxID=1864939 RepID=UPI00214DE823|nr:FecR domain-containing protein [Parapedobacter lycopersici]